MTPAEARDIALDVGRAAAVLLREASGSGHIGPIHRKKGLRTDWVTEWDVRSERLIIDGLRSRAPGTRILGEEGGATGDTSAAAAATAGRWLVDPVDGTVNFAHGLPIYGVSIGYEENGQLLAGVVLAPSLQWEFAAARGQGATMNTVPIRVSDTADLSDAMLATGFPADRATSPRNNYAQFAHFQNTGAAVRRLGSASLDLCLVARGWFDGYWEFKLHPWDLAAGALIVEEAGGRISALDGTPYDVNVGEIIASNGHVHDRIVEELRRTNP